MRLFALAFCLSLPAIAQTPITILTTSLPSGTVGTPYPATSLSAAGGAVFTTYTWGVSGSLPPGLTLQATGALYGTPTAAGSFTFAITVRDTQQNFTGRNFTVIITAPGSPQRPGITTASLPAGMVGQAYNQFLSATGGSPPYQWGLTQGTLPAGLALDRATGAISGTPTSAGASSFQVQAVDSASQASLAAQLSITINPPPLTIVTTAPLFVGSVGQAYAQTFTASGGAKPYTWSIVSGDPGGLKLDSASGVLQGTPQATGAFPFTIQVADAVGATSTQSYSLTINAPSLVVTLAAQPAPGAVGIPYDQKLALVVTGGTAPIIWSVLSGSVPGLSFDPLTLHLSGAPLSAGTFSLTIQARDGAGLSASRAVAVTIAPASLSIVSARQLPAVALNGSYSFALSATGGTPPYTWSANGLPAGLNIDPSSGVIAGTASAAGSFSPVITVRDATLGVVQDLFSLTVNLPAAPPIEVSGLPATIEPRQQIALNVAVGSAYPAPITGTAQLTFTPESGLPDRTVVFASGATSVRFTIPAGSTTPQFESPLVLQTGTVAGTLSVSLAITAGSLDITPQPAPSCAAQILRAAPVIADAQVSRASGALSITVTGYATTREITQAIFTFSAAAGQTLQPSAASITVDVGSLFSNWYQNAATTAYGSQFAFTQPFTVDGDASAITPVSVTLKNRDGSTTLSIRP